MTKKTLSPKKIELYLKNKKQASDAIARKIAKQPDILTSTKATRTLNGVRRELEQIQETMKLDPALYGRYLEQLVDSYIAIMKKYFPKAKTNFRREEIFIAIVTHSILDYHPDTRPAYLGGDKVINQKIKTDIQIKSPQDVFRIFYDIDQMEKDMKAAGFKPATIEAAILAASQEYTYTYKDLTNLKGKMDFMARYLKISQANWYLLFFDNISSYTAVGVPKELLLQFVRVFHRYLKPIKDRGRDDFYALKLDLTYAAKFHAKVWSGIVSAKSVIHYRDADSFYKDRQHYMSYSDIKAYNENFWSASHKAGNLQIQNAIFAPIQYKGKR